METDAKHDLCCRNWKGTMSRRTLLPALLIALTLIAAFVLPARAFAQNEGPTVTVVFFWSPTCPHCHDVIENVLPVLDEQFGDQLEVVFANVQSPAVQSTYTATCTAVHIPADRCGSVPLMIIGDAWLMGSDEIQFQAAGLIEAGLSAGGIALPQIPGMEAVYNLWIAETGGVPDATLEELASLTMSERFALEPFANSLAVVVLIGLVASAGIVLFNGLRYRPAPPLEGSRKTKKKATRRQTFIFSPKLRAAAGFLAAALTAFLGLTIVLGPGAEALPAVLGFLTAAVMGLIAILLAGDAFGRPGGDFPRWLMPAASLVGLLVAGYMTYVEATANPAVCGAVGNCNAVQESQYATLFGFLHVGLLGVIGYLAILGAWIVADSQEGRNADLASAALLIFTVAGVAFSAYLTFLEPFVIGASCAWCLTSALLMMLVLWFSAEEGWAAIGRLRRNRT
jgi:uncharacterized membrane protein/thiol-disulfide isomerase/thioredoxin